MAVMNDLKTEVYRTRVEMICMALNNAIALLRRGRLGDAEIWISRVANHKQEISQAFGVPYLDVFGEVAGGRDDKKKISELHDRYEELRELAQREAEALERIRMSEQQKVEREAFSPQVSETPTGRKVAVGYHDTYQGDDGADMSVAAPFVTANIPVDQVLPEGWQVIGRQITRDSDAAVISYNGEEVARVPYAQIEATRAEAARMVAERSEQLFRLRTDFESRYGISPSNDELERFIASGASLDDVDDQHRLTITHDVYDNRVFTVEPIAGSDGSLVVSDKDGNELLRAPHGSLSFDPAPDPDEWDDESALLRRAFTLMLEREDFAADDVIGVEAAFDPHSLQLEVEFSLRRRVTIGCTLD